VRQTLSSIQALDMEAPASDASPRSRWSYYYGVGVTSLIGSCGEIMLLVLPAYLAVIGHSVRLTAPQLGFVASAASGGLFAGSFLSAFALSRFSARAIARTMLSAAAIMQLLLILAGSFFLVVSATFLAALAGGLAYGAIYAVLSLQREPARAFAIFVALQLIFNFVLLFVATYLMELAGGRLGLLGLLAVCGLAFAALAGAVPNARTVRAAAAVGSQRAHSVELALGGFFLFAVGMGATWAFIELFAEGRGFVPRVIEHILSYGQLAALAGAVLAMWIGRSRVNPWLLLASVGASSAGVFLISTSAGLPLFTAACLFTGAAWNFSLPFQFATISFLDSTGRAGALASSFHAAGLATGPLIGSAILAVATDDWIIVAAAASMFLALLCFIIPAARLRSVKRM
jgi:predicted MFS family arabinose efflux permease